MLIDIPYIFYLALVLSTLNVFVLGRNFYLGFLTALKVRTFTMDSLITIGTFSAYLFSLLMATHHYFEVASSLITFVSLGKWLESLAQAKTSQAVEKLINLSPKIAHLKTGQNFQDLPLNQINSGDTLLVKPGEIIPLDGIITSGSSSLDQSSLTGESLPVDKAANNQIYAGTQNLTGSFEFRVTSDSSHTLLSQVIKLVEDAQSSRAPIQDFADKISAYFVPAVLIIALTTFLLWQFVFQVDLSTSLLYFLAVIVIACPCALGLATPTVIIVATGLAARLGILIKGGQALQQASTINTLVFDKTGTLTTGHPQVINFKNYGQYSDSKIKEIAYSLESRSDHPIVRAIVDFSSPNQNLPLKSFKSVTGFGVKATIGHQNYFLGKTKTNQIELQENHKLLATFEVADTLKPDSQPAINHLQRSGFSVYLLSGDNQSNAQAVGQLAGITPDHIFADLLPDQKTQKIKELQSPQSRLAFIGDGINDSPSLAQSDLGIVMGSGADIALESGSVVIMNNQVSSLLHLFTLSRKSLAKIKQNFVYALIYNLIGIPIAAGLFSPLGLTLRPEFAALAMSLSSLSVVLNSLALNRLQLNH